MPRRLHGRVTESWAGIDGGVSPGRAGRLLLGNSAIYTVGNMLPQAINVLLLPVFTRYLSRTEFGIFAYTTAICAFLSVAGNLSIHSYVLRHYFDCRTEDERRRLFGSIASFLIVYNVALLAVELLVLPPLFRLAEAQVPFEPYMRLALLANAIEVLGILPLAYFRVKERAGTFIMLTLLQTALSAGLSCYLVVGVGMGVLGRYYGVLAADLAMLVVFTAVLSRIGTWSWDLQHLRRAAAFSAPLTLAGALAIVMTMSDRLVLERFVPLDQLGLYSVGVSIAYGVNSLSNGIYKAIEPQVYRLAATSGLDEHVVRMKRTVVWLLVALGAVMIAFSREIVTLLAAPAFHESYTILAIVVPAVVLRGVTIPLSTYAVAVHRTGAVSLVNLGGAVVSLVANLALVPRLGIQGAALASIAAWLAIFFMYRAVTERERAIRWRIRGDLVLMACAFGFAVGVLQVETSHLLVSVALKGLLLALPAGLLVSWHLRPRDVRLA